jgi:hypothetical protein
MTDVDQYFSDPELESIINNATEKPVTASSSSDDALSVVVIIIIVLYAITTIMQLVRYVQTQNGLHILLFMSSLIVIVVAALEITEAVDESFTYEVSPFIFLIIDWTMIIIPTYLLFIWIRSMLGRLQTKYKQHFKFVKTCFSLFTITKLSECTILILCRMDMGWSKYSWYYDYYVGARWYGVAFLIKLVIETLLVCYLGLFCIKIRGKFQDVIDLELRSKRRQLLRPFLMYLVQFFYLGTLLVILAFSLKRSRRIMMRFMNGHQEYSITIVLLLYHFLTISPRNAITGFGKVPDQPTVVPGQPVFVPGQPIVMMGQPTLVAGQPTVLMDQPAIVTAQPTVVMDQPASMPGQSVVMTDQPAFVMGQPTFMPGQPTFMMEQPTFVMGQPTVVQDQSTIVQDQPTFVPGQPIVVPAQPTYVQSQPDVMPDQPSLLMQKNPESC